MVATAELLDLLPEDHSDRPDLIRILNQQAKGIASVEFVSGQECFPPLARMRPGVSGDQPTAGVSRSEKPSCPRK